MPTFLPARRSAVLFVESRSGSVPYECVYLLDDAGDVDNVETVDVSVKVS